MRIRALTLTLAVVAAPWSVRSAAADGSAEAYAKQMEAKAASIVNVKFVAKVQMGRPGQGQGQGQEREVNGTSTGVVVDAAGVVMIPNDLVTGGGGRRLLPSVRAIPSNFRVLFEGDVKEYEAILGATDSKLGVQFIRIKDLGDRKVVPLDLSSAVDPKVGDELFGVTRLEQGFDYAPFYGVAHLVGQVAKPRSMWMLSGFARVAHPLYTADGKVAGVVVRQSGVSEGEESGGGGADLSFLLPAKVIAATIAQAVKASAEALEKSKAAATKEPGEPAAAPGDAPGMTDAPATPPGMEDPR